MNLKTTTALLLTMALSSATLWAQATEGNPLEPTAGTEQVEQDGSEPALDLWIDELISRLTDPEPKIRVSAMEALVSIGQPAVEKLEAVKDGENPGITGVADDVLTRIRSPGTAAAARAWGRSRRGANHGQRDLQAVSTRIAEQLELDQAASTKLASGLQQATERRQEIVGLFRQGEISRDEVLEQLEGIGTKLRTELGEFLTEEQVEQVLKKAGMVRGSSAG